MKTRTSVLVLMMTMCPLVGRAQVCTDFDDDMNIIEYDCSRSLADVKREISEAKAKAEAEAKAAKARAEAEEAARIAAEKAAKEKAVAEEKARKEAEKKAAAEKAKAEETARQEAKAQAYKQCKLDSPRHVFLAGTCMDTKYFVAAGFMTETMNEDFSPSGVSAEIGMRLDPVQNNWYYTFSIMGQTASDSKLYQVVTASNVMPAYDLSLESLYLTAGVGYKFWRVFDVYGKIAPGVMSMKLSSAEDNVNGSESMLGAAGIVGLNARLYKWLHVYGEAQLSVNHPTVEVDFVEGNERSTNGNSIMYQPKQTFEWGTILSMRGGVKLVF